MANTNSSKGNPASKRMGNKARQARRAASWAKNQKRKDAEKKRVAEAEKRNKNLRAQGLPTPHQESARRCLTKKEKVDA